MNIRERAELGLLKHANHRETIKHLEAKNAKLRARIAELESGAAPERSVQAAQPQPAIQTPEQKMTNRGFSLIEFTDRYGVACSLQKSSLATEDAIWLGCDDAAPKIMARMAAAHGITTDETTGWVPFPIPDAVSINTRMHLTQDQVAMLLPILAHFVATGEVVAAAPVIQAQPLTDADIEVIARQSGTGGWLTLTDMNSFARKIERHLTGATPARGEWSTEPDAEDQSRADEDWFFHPNDD